VDRLRSRVEADRRGLSASDVSELEELRTRAVEDLSAPVVAGAYAKESDALFGRAQLARLRGDPPQAAVDLLTEATRLAPLHAESIALLSRIAEETGYVDDALRYATKAIGYHNGLAEAYLARCLAETAKAAQAPPRRAGAVAAARPAGRGGDGARGRGDARRAAPEGDRAGTGERPGRRAGGLRRRASAGSVPAGGVGDAGGGALAARGV
jgi:hypothetical protein